jgi:hypothetical protein
MCAPSKGEYRLLVAGFGRVAVPVFRGIYIYYDLQDLPSRWRNQLPDRILDRTESPNV